ncbi:MAG: hypothetical protein ACE5HE_00095 [Phycisphaerae bacterium]
MDCVPCDPVACPFPQGISAHESWGPATAIVAERFPWTAGAVRLIVPIGDEGPCNGNFPDGCDVEGDDGESITNAIAIAKRHDVIVSPIAGTNSNSCVISLTAQLAAETGGVTYMLQNALTELSGAIDNALNDACPACKLVDLVVVMDTSGSMGDEAVALCSNTAQIIAGLRDAGVTVNMTLLGITENPGGLFSCISDNVLERLGGEVTSACDDLNPCTGNDSCTGHVCAGAELRDCIKCDWDVECGDADQCTDDFCGDQGVCTSVPNFDDTVYCCNPATRELTQLDDGDPCTDDICDPATGSVGHPPAAVGTSCDDKEVCTANDTCDGSGACLGTDLTLIPCTSDADCFESVCDETTGLCECLDQPTLCLTADRSDCYAEGDIVQINVELGYGLHVISGGQFSVSYDPSVLKYVSLAPGSTVTVEDPFVESPFGIEIHRIVDEVAGTIFYAVGVDFRAKLQGTRGPTVMAVMRFRALTPCSSSDVCFFDDPPRTTLLTDDKGSRVFHVPCCADGVSVSGPPLELNAPESLVVDADAGTLSSDVTWDPVTSSGGCNDQVELTCTATHSDDISIDHLIAHGGRFAAGESRFECVANDLNCAGAAAASWTVTVREVNQVDLDVQLAPTVSTGPLERCIEFEFFRNCLEESVAASRQVSFGRPFNLPGHTRHVGISLPAGQYGCVTAWDPVHTLRSAAGLEISGSSFVAGFGDDPLFGGNWLIGGNLDGSRAIDVIDIGIWYVQNGTVVDPNTTCDFAALHADINGDGIVDALDRVFIDQNWLTAETDTCCADTSDPAQVTPVTEISIRDLKRMGLGDLSDADINRDGLLNLADVALIRQGLQPTPPKGVRLRDAQ